ncbi:MAG TPA: sugar phosphate isomerase/epimerase [Bryobacteraceae bacterium]|nr:sugar phosphate isomerase/epimerase [Bryobacteraceae bacterium]
MTSRRAFLSVAGSALPLAAKQKFSGPLGLEIYSLRRQAQKDLPGTLAMIREMGFKELEVGGYYGRTVSEFKRMLAANGLAATSMMAGWDQLSNSTGKVAEEARTLGSGYVVCGSIPHKKPFSADDAHRAADHFNKWGEALKSAGLQFCYHAHGFEFGASPDGTLFDTMAKRMDPKVANFQMDVFWIAFGKEDPAKLLERYAGRFPLMHLKDIRKGEAKTGNPGDVVEEASVPLGTGEIDWPSVLSAARKTGVRRYYIEEEHPDAVKQIPKTLRYLENIRF